MVTLLATASSGCRTGPMSRCAGRWDRQSQPISTFAARPVSSITVKRASTSPRSSTSTVKPSIR
ncbi:hypothetical protein B4N89_27075 [Embleya scabrispora]|uniref:Uncharacterized protein n=1 Tax=Embleya scabrispora TaxID=159449 RepID=A0A1T3P591_9ACTN|nr:hypothetical protein B4N89_27075 [Embleya scabrispora]